MGESERNEQQHLPASHQHPLQSCHSPAPHKQSHCLTISRGWGYKVYHSPAALFTLASCEDLFVFVRWFPLGCICFLESNTGGEPWMPFAVKNDEFSRRTAKKATSSCAKIQRLVEFEQITRWTSVKFSVPVTEDSSHWRLKAVPQAITQPSVMFI